MVQFLNLIRNELMKIFKRTGTRVMFVILLAFVVIVGLVTKFALDASETEGDWQNRLHQENAAFEQQLESGNLSEVAAAQMEEEKALNTYHLDENIEPLNPAHSWHFIINNPQLANFLTVFTVIVASGVVAGEHSKGTIKLLLIRPARRWKILLAKWSATMIFSVFMLIALFLFSVAAAFALFEFTGAPVRHVEMAGGDIRDMNVFLYGLAVYGFSFVDPVMMTTFAFMIGTVFRNQSLAIGLSLVLLFTGTQLVSMLIHHDWIKYILFTNTYVRQYFEGDVLIEGMTPLFSAAVLAGYFILFQIISMTVFTKRDVAE